VTATIKYIVIVSLAFLLSAAMPVCLIMFVGTVAVAIDGGSINEMIGLLGIIPFIYLISLVFIVIFGVPSYLLLQFLYGRIDWVDALWCGFLGGVVVSLFIVGPTNILPLTESYKPIFLFTILGILAAGVFWLVLKAGGVNARS